MSISRRGLLGVLAGALAAPAIIRTSGLLMPVRQIILPAPPAWNVPDYEVYEWKRAIASDGTVLIRLEEHRGPAGWQPVGPYRQWPLMTAPIAPVRRVDDPRAMRDDKEYLASIGRLDLLEETATRWRKRMEPQLRVNEVEYARWEEEYHRSHSAHLPNPLR